MELIKFIENYSNNLRADEILYHSYIKNKKVVIVGPSPWMNGKSFGKQIDEYDIVIRVNQGIFLPTKNSKDFGSRTDIIYTSQRARDQYGLNFPKEFEECKFISLLVQRKTPDFPAITCFICNKQLQNSEEYCLNKDWMNGSEKKIGHTLCIHPEKDYDSYKIPIVKRDIALYMTYYKSSLLSGMLALVDMLQFQAKQIDIIGFDFYDSIKTMLETNSSGVTSSQIYCTGYEFFHDTMRLSHKDEDGKQLFLLKILINKYKHINIDENLNRIMKERLEYINSNNYNSQYNEYIKNKKVIIVGPAPYMIGKGYGDFIDSFDIVIRINMGALLCKNSKDFGTKKNVVYINQKIRERFGLELDVFKDYEYICAQTFYNNDTKCKMCNNSLNGEIYVNEVFTNGFQLEKSHMSCVCYCNYSLVNKKIVLVNSTPALNYFNEIPLTGLTAISHILQMQPNELYVTGFDFFDGIKMNKGYNVSASQFYAEGYGTIEPVNITTKDISSKQLTYFKQLYKKQKFGIDNNIIKILKL